MRILGIDLMDQGALALLDGSNEPIIWDMPTFIARNRPEPDIPAIVQLITSVKFDTACVEMVHTMPAKFGGGLCNYKRGAYMFLFRTLFTALGRPFIEVHPANWQKVFSIRGEDTKGQAYLIASQLFPNMVLKSKKNKILDGRCDALLIAEYGRRTLK